MGICAQCQHFRRARPVSQLLAAVFTNRHSDISQALNKLVEDERKLRDSEAEYMRAQASNGKSEFLGRPMMTDFCALEESNGTYIIAPVRNAGGRCADFVSGQRARQSCSECGHRVPATGRARDEKMDRILSDVSRSSVSAGLKGGQGDAMVTNERKDAISRQVFELSGVALAGGEMSTQPEYLDYCDAFSTPGTFVVCALKNPYDSCDHWERAGAAKSPDERAAAQGPVEQEPEETEVEAPPVITMPPSQTPAGAAIRPSQITEALVRRVAEAFAWILDVAIPAQVIALMAGAMLRDAGHDDQASLASLMQLVQLYESVKPQNKETRDAVREMHQPGIVAALRQGDEDATRALLALYDAANAPIAAGNPPLTREIANCYLDLLGFVQSLRMNVDWQPLPEAMRGMQLQVIASQYPMLPPPTQAWFGSLPQGWTQMRAAWINSAPETRGQLRAQILASVGVPAAPQAYPPNPGYGYPPPPAQYGYAGYPQTAPSPYPQAAPPFPQQPPAYGNAQPQPSGDDTSSEALLNRIFEEDKKKVAEAAKDNPELANQITLQNAARNAQMLSDMSRMRFDSMMTVARNFK
ncbi:MAG TPA: hypothetical protein VKH42_12895 [Vicinamibacterales bacterium]|nr:hypothetical protein [Vicinamibacterales bacterium]